MAEKLFKEFPPVSTQEWEAQILTDLKGADYQKKLVWKTLEGLCVRPYYREEDLTDTSYLQAAPGSYPYARGNKETNDWIIHQTFTAKGCLEEANAQALDALRRGADGVGFAVDPDHSHTVAQLAVLFKNIDLSVTPVAFDYLSGGAEETLRHFMEYVRGLPGVNPDNLRVRFGADPVRCLMTGTHTFSEEAWSSAAACVKYAEGYPGISVIGVGGYLFNNMGAGVLQELVYSLSIASQVMEVLCARNIPASVAASSLYFQMGVSVNYFMEMAKFRVLRLGWARLMEAHGLKGNDCPKCRIHAVTGTWNQTVYDRYVNLLRGTTEAMSAAMAGVDSLEVLPFDYALGGGNDFSRRLARNTQIILKEESHLNKIADPAGGSYYVENLTKSLLQACMEQYTELSASGGYVANFLSGRIPGDIATTVAKRAKLLETRRESLLGVNQFPDFSEQAPDALTLDALEHSQRGAAPFEALRLRTERSGKQPVAFLLTFGNLAMCRARAQFSANFFAVAGIKVIDNNRFATIEEGVKAALESGAQLIVACSSDEEYAEAVPQIVSLTGNPARVVVAGEPACKEDLVKAGITHFISVRNNLLETLGQYQKELGIQS